MSVRGVGEKVFRPYTPVVRIVRPVTGRRHRGSFLREGVRQTGSFLGSGWGSPEWNFVSVHPGPSPSRWGALGYEGKSRSGRGLYPVS